MQIFSNGRYRSVVHRVLVNSRKSRISVASLHSLPFKSTVRPSPKLIDEANPTRYKDTDFASFLQYISNSSHDEMNAKTFLQSRKLTWPFTQKVDFYGFLSYWLPYACLRLHMTQVLLEILNFMQSLTFPLLLDSILNSQKLSKITKLTWDNYPRSPKRDFLMHGILDTLNFLTVRCLVKITKS